ncbi:MAG TPA: methylmalonyl-CoA epimerase [Dehalococcoidia bacterium]|nr:methylmalonyl-CoA epimerase [Dehalococcoidia bacterium]
MIKRIHHVCIAVHNLDESLELYSSLFGVRPSKIKELPEQGVRAALMPLSQGGEIELIEPLNPESGTAKFLEKRGEGIHHFCLETDDTDQELCLLADKGVELIDKKARRGLAGLVGFLHPKSTKGALIEIAQEVPD